MPSSIHAANAALAAVFAGVHYVSLHVGDPGRLGANELSGGNYRRQASTFSLPDQGSVSNNATLYFVEMPESKPTHFGVWSGSNHFEWGGVLRPPHGIRGLSPVHAGNTLMIPAGVIQIVME